MLTERINDDPSRLLKKAVLIDIMLPASRQLDQLVHCVVMSAPPSLVFEVHSAVTKLKLHILPNNTTFSSNWTDYCTQASLQA